MRSLTRIFIVWIAAVATGAAALVPTGAEGVTVTLTPEELMTGATVATGQSYPMTLNVQGAADSTYDVSTTSEGGVGDCSTSTGSVATDSDGNGSWTCDFTASSEAATGAVTFFVSSEGSEVGFVRALLTIEAAEEPEAEPEDETEDELGGEKADNHGGCVSYWVHRAKDDGLRGKHFGGFISGIAQSECTTATREDAQYVTAFEEALAAQEAATAADEETPKQKPAKDERGNGKHSDDDGEDEGGSEDSEDAEA